MQKCITAIWHMYKTGVSNMLMPFACWTKDSAIFQMCVFY